MARPKRFITDFRHLPGEVDIEGRSFPAFLASIVALASLEGPACKVRSPIRCRCRPRRRPCPGVILVDRHAGDSEIEWRCSECELNGVITDWKGSSWDLATEHRSHAGKVQAPPRRHRISSLEGRWRIETMERWDKDAIDLLGPGFIEFEKHGGSMRFIAVEGELDCRHSEREGRPVVEFSWLGHDDADSTCGRGWARLEPDGSLVGHLFVHCGEDSAFTARPFKART